MIMEATQIINENQNSVEISINAKMQYSGKIKVYAKTIEEAMEKSLEKVRELEEIIKEKNQNGI